MALQTDEQQQEEEEITSTIDKGFVISVLRRLFELTVASRVGKCNQQDSADSATNTSWEKREKEQIEKCCILWDLSASQEFAAFLVDNHLVDVLLPLIDTMDTAEGEIVSAASSPRSKLSPFALSVTPTLSRESEGRYIECHSDRLYEVCVGILANACVWPPICDQFSENTALVSLIFDKLFVTPHIFVLSETLRLLSVATNQTAISSSTHQPINVRWIEHIAQHQYTVPEATSALSHLLFIVENSLDLDVLTRASSLLLNLVFYDKSSDPVCQGSSQPRKSCLQQLLSIPKFLDMLTNALADSIDHDHESVTDTILRVIEVIVDVAVATQLPSNADTISSLSRRVIQSQRSDQQPQPHQLLIVDELFKLIRNSDNIELISSACTLLSDLLNVLSQPPDQQDSSNYCIVNFSTLRPALFDSVLVSKIVESLTERMRSNATDDDLDQGKVIPAPLHDTICSQLRILIHLLEVRTLDVKSCPSSETASRINDFAEALVVGISRHTKDMIWVLKTVPPTLIEMHALVIRVTRLLVMVCSGLEKAGSNDHAQTLLSQILTEVKLPT